jgi:hypothetical protein
VAREASHRAEKSTIYYVSKPSGGQPRKSKPVLYSRCYIYNLDEKDLAMMSRHRSQIPLAEIARVPPLISHDTETRMRHPEVQICTDVQRVQRRSLGALI